MEGANPSMIPDSQSNAVSLDDEILQTRQDSLFMPFLRLHCKLNLNRLQSRIYATAARPSQPLF